MPVTPTVIPDSGKTKKSPLRGFEEMVEKGLSFLDRLYKKYHLIVDIVFYVAFVSFILVCMFNYAETSVAHAVLYQKIVKSYVKILDQKILPVLAGLAILFDLKDKKLKYAAFFSLFILMLHQIGAERDTISIIPHCSNYAFGAGCLVVAAAGRDFRRIGWVYVIVGTIFTTVLTLLCFMTISGLIDWVPDATVTQERGVRHSFGMDWPLFWTGRWLPIILTYSYLKNGLHKWWEYLILIVITVVGTVWCKNRTHTVLFVALFAVALYRQLNLQKGWYPKLMPTEKMKDLMAKILVFSFWIFAAYMFLGTLLYFPPISTFLKKIPGELGTLNGRFPLGRIGLFENAPTWNPTTWLGKRYASRTDLYIDCGYIKVFVWNGVVVFAITMADLLYFPWRLYKHGQRYALFLMGLFACFIALQSHLLDIGHDPFLLMTFSVLGGTEVKKRIDLKKKDPDISNDVGNAENTENTDNAENAENTDNTNTADSVQNNGVV